MLSAKLRLKFRLRKSKTTVDMETREGCYSLLWRIFRQLPTEARTRRVFGSHFQWRWCCGPTQQVLAKVYQPLPIVSEKLGRPKSGKAIIVIVSPLVALMDDQVKEAAKLGLCAAQLASNNREIMEGNFSLILDSQSKMASYAGINPIPRQPRHHCCWRGTRRIQMLRLHTRVWSLISTS